MTGPEPKPDGAAGTGGGLRAARRGVATTVWLLAVLAALILAAGALVVALDLDRRGSFVDVLLSTADTLDVVGVLDEVGPDGKGQAARQDALARTVLVNWGLCAVAYLVVGKVFDRLIRP